MGLPKRLRYCILIHYIAVNTKQRPLHASSGRKKKSMNKIKRMSRRPRRPRRATAGTLPLEVLMKFRSVINSAKRHFKWVERQCGINGAQLWALWELDQTPGLRVNELAAAMAVHQSTASVILNNLVRAGLVERKRSNADQRVVNLSITGAGRKLLAQAPRPARGVLPEALHRLAPGDLQSLDQLLQRVLSEMRGDPRSMKDPLGELLMKN
jgi:MarR family transcriptional regulator, organic hydroperoxide resistance regulator